MSLVQGALGRSSLVIIGRCAGAAIGLGVQLLLARSLSGEDLGTVYMAMAVGGIGAVVAASGYPSVAVRFIRRYLVRGQTLRAAQFVRSIRREAMGLALAVALAAGAVVWLAPIPDTLRGPFSLGIAALPAFALLALNGGVANALRRVDISYLPDVLLRPTVWFVCLLAMTLAGEPLTAVSVLAAALAAVCFAAVVQSAAMARLNAFSGADRRDTVTGAPARVAGLWRRAALPMIAVTLLTNLVFDIDVILLGFVLPPAELAVFGIAFKIAFFVAFAVHIAQQAALPDIADAYAASDRAAMRHAIRHCGLRGVVAAGAVSIVLVLLGDLVLGLFGEAFERGHGTLVTLALCPLIRAAFGPAQQVLVLAGQQRLIITIHAAGVAVLAGLNVVLVGAFGVFGAAMALLLATAFWSAALAYGAWRVTDVRPDVFSIDRPAIPPSVPVAP